MSNSATRAEGAPLRLLAAEAWQREGWRQGLAWSVDADGILRADAGGAEPQVALDGLVLPGIANLHSHAFQRAMAGRAERRGPSADSFWTWRETMYALAARVTPEALFDTAAQLYLEMLEAGYTRVCEFHYLHHQADGRPHAEPAAMAQALIAAAREVGIGLTVLPTLYCHGGFDRRPLSPRQARFGHDVDAFLRLVQSLRAEQDAQLRVGIAFHSLRAVDEDAMRTVLAALDDDPTMPVHLHIAEQTAEVDECLALRGARPVRWLLDRFEVGPRWTLVHATHLDAGEVRDLARSGATVAICPTTEGNLGDGFFPLVDYQAAGGRWGIGSDSHVSISPVEELRWLEYGQRLLHRARNLAATAERPGSGESLFAACAASAGNASGVPAGELLVGQRADLLVLDASALEFARLAPAQRLDAWLLASQRPLVRDVHVGGRRVVAAGRHPRRDEVEARYRARLDTLFPEHWSSDPV